MLPTISFSQLEETIQNEGITLKQQPIIDDPSLLLEREVRLTPEFYYKQLRALGVILSVEEWEDVPSFKLRWFNTNSDLPLKRFVLYYNQKKRILKKKYVYKGRASLVEQKENISKQALLSAVKRGDSSIIGEGFREI
ncbi:hypothetical protein R4Z10_12390 [Niallia sp. XMNu-256]|uniref:hypothetical protein n=1 Tax=Niallia sp. XMNu-256 TaxID=3082444 RepID=UPI0030CD08FE